MRTALFCFMIFICSSCNIRNHDDKGIATYLPELTNEVLKKNIIKYAKENRRKMLYAKNLIHLDYKLSSDTTVYRIQHVSNMGYFLHPNISAIFKVSNIYVGYRNIWNSYDDIEMSTQAIFDILSDDYPSFKDDYAMYLKRKKYQHLSEYDCLLPFYATFGDAADIWVLKFVKGVLVSKSIE